MGMNTKHFPRVLPDEFCTMSRMLLGLPQQFQSFISSLTFLKIPLFLIAKIEG